MAKPYLSNEEEIQRLQQHLTDWTNRKDELTKKIISLNIGKSRMMFLHLASKNRKVSKMNKHEMTMLYNTLLCTPGMAKL